MTHSTKYLIGSYTKRDIFVSRKKGATAAQKEWICIGLLTGIFLSALAFFLIGVRDKYFFILVGFILFASIALANLAWATTNQSLIFWKFWKITDEDIQAFREQKIESLQNEITENDKKILFLQEKNSALNKAISELNS